MGKGGKKKGRTNKQQSDDAGPSATAPRQQAPPQPQPPREQQEQPPREQQEQPPRHPQQRQERETPVAQITTGVAQMSMGAGQAGRGGGGQGHQGQRQNVGRGQEDSRMQGQGRGGPPGQGQTQQPPPGRGRPPGQGQTQQPPPGRGRPLGQGQTQQPPPGRGGPQGQGHIQQPPPGMQGQGRGGPQGQGHIQQPPPGMQGQGRGGPQGQGHIQQPPPGMQGQGRGGPQGQGHIQQPPPGMQGQGRGGPQGQGQIQQPPPGMQGQGRGGPQGQGQIQQPPPLMQGGPRPGWTPQGQGQTQQPPPGMQASSGDPGRGQSQQRGRGGQGRGGEGGRGRGEPMQEQPRSHQSSTPSPASSVAGDTTSVSSGKAASTPASPLKTSIPKAEQQRLLSLIPKRQNPNKGGTAGRRITVETNMIPIMFGKNFTNSIIHYDVKIEPDKPRIMYRPVMEAVRLKHYPKQNPGFDGRCNLFAAGRLPFGDELRTEVPVFNRERQLDSTFVVTLTRAQDIDTSWLKNVKPGFSETEREQMAITAVDVILRSVAIRRQAKTVGRSLFIEPEKGRVLDLGNGMDLWVGTFQSVILGWKPYFNVDVAHKGFPKSQPVIELIRELCQGITAEAVKYGKMKLQQYLKGLKVTYEIPGIPSSRRTWGINDLARSARDETFQLDDGSISTVENYFAREKRYTLRYPELPTLWVGSRQKHILIPVELCVIEVGQVTNKKLDERQTSTMIKHAATNTATRKQKIMDGFSKMRFNEDPAMKEFGISVSAGFETVNARVLEPPSLTDKRQIVVRRGVWRANGFKTAMILPDKSWTILNLNYRTQDPALRNFVQCLQNGGANLGMTIGEPITPFVKMESRSRDVRQIIQFFQEKKKEGLKLVVVVVPDKTGPEYGRIKQVAELNVGVLTQCIKAVTIERKMNDATAGNILLKVNAKLNGTNQIFTEGKLPSCLKRPCMIVGADVTHPSPDAIGIPSIAAVAASYNPNAFRYNVEIRLQPPRTEIIQHLQEIIQKQLKFFYIQSRQKPEHIIFYRDGVSEGQFPQVMHHELQAIRNACRALGGATKYEPAITFLVVQKRHHIRMFPTDPKNSDDRNGNVQAGTVVDTEITHPSDIDFYLVSHASIQGTARPTKYRCLWNDNNMSEDEIEQLTYYLCHMFSRCTRSVSYPAPTYYAHLAAFRARALTNEVDIRLNNLEEEQRLKMTIKEDILTGNPMFFV